MEAFLHGRRIRLGGRRQRALLALLLLEPGRVVSLDRLIEELWQGRPPARGDTTIRSYVSRLRAVLGRDAVAARSAGYAVAADPSQVDAQRFERLLRQGRDTAVRGAAGHASELFHAALELWRGPALADVAEGGALALEARRLDELRLVCIEEAVDADLALGRHAELVPELERLVREEPLRERFSRQLVLAYYRAGRQADALAAYRSARDTLVNELGLEPTAELRELERAVLHHDVAAVAPAQDLHNLPAQTTSFVGRERELAELKSLLRERRLVTLTGPGGTGKTRLALEVAALQASAWTGGVWLVDLTPLSDPALVVPAVAASVGAVDSTPAKGDALLDQLRSLELLLVLDNCEHLATACAEFVEAALRACPHVHVLATSRVPLAVAGEFDYGVDPLGVPDETAPVEELERAEAVQLFVARGQALRRDLADAQSLAAIGGICRELDGLPLAIELAAARAKALSLEEIAARLRDRFRFLRAWKRVADPRHQTLRATMDWSYDLLAADEKTLLAQLSVFTGSFTLLAVAAVCFEGDDDRAADLVARLVDSSLVRAEQGEGMRYRLLGTVREYAAERLDAKEEQALRRRHAEHYLELARSANLGAEAEGGARRLDVARAEAANVRAALEWCIGAGEVELGLELAAALENFWAVYDPSGGMRTFEALLADAREIPALLRARALRCYGSTSQLTGRPEQARDAFEQSLALFRDIGSERDIGVLLHRIGNLAIARGEVERARTVLEESLEVSSRVGSRRIEAQVIGSLGKVARAEGDLERAVALFAESANLVAELGFTWWESSMAGELAACALRLGRLDEAADHARRMLILGKQMESRSEYVWAFAYLALVAARQGAARRAGRLWGAVEAEEARGAIPGWEEEDRTTFTAEMLAEPSGAFEEARAQGRRLSRDEAIEYALQRG